MRFHVQLHVGDQIAETKALLDNGATHSFIDTEYARALGCRLYRLERPAPVRNADFKARLQLLDFPQVITEECDSLDPNALIDFPDVLRAELGDAYRGGVFLALCVYGDGRIRRERCVRGRKGAARRRQARAHHVCASEEEPDGASVHPHCREDRGV